MTLFYLAGRTAHPAFLVTNKQREKQMKIENEKPWSGLESAHQQYAEHATDMLRQCRYKHMALKIINVCILLFYYYFTYVKRKFF